MGFEPRYTGYNVGYMTDITDNTLEDNSSVAPVGDLEKTIAMPEASPRSERSLFKRAKAFTLVELLVVITIITGLVSILAPTLGRAREMARRSVCGGNLNSLGKGIVMYAEGNRGRIPRVLNSLADPTAQEVIASVPTKKNHGTLTNGGCISGPNYFFCPSATFYTKDGKFGWQNWDKGPNSVISSYTWGNFCSANYPKNWITLGDVAWNSIDLVKRYAPKEPVIEAYTSLAVSIDNNRLYDMKRFNHNNSGKIGHVNILYGDSTVTIVPDDSAGNSFSDRFSSLIFDWANQQKGKNR